MSKQSQHREHVPYSPIEKLTNTDLLLTGALAIGMLIHESIQLYREKLTRTALAGWAGVVACVGAPRRMRALIAQISKGRFVDLVGRPGQT